MTLPPSVARAVSRSNADLAAYQEIESRKMAKASSGKGTAKLSASLDKDGERIRALAEKFRGDDDVLAETVFNAGRLLQAAAERVRAFKKS